MIIFVIQELETSQAAKKWLIMVYQVSCCMLAIYYSFLQLEQFYANEDASVISFRSFNQRPEDRYPDITTCIKEGRFNDGIQEFTEPEFFKKYGIKYGFKGTNEEWTTQVFTDILKGQPGETHDNGLSNQTLNKIAIMDPELYFANLKNIIKRFTFKTNKKVESYERSHVEWKKRDAFLDHTFHINYQDPDRICFTKTHDFEKERHATKISDEVVLDFSQTTSEVNLQLFLHPPGQFLRNIEGPTSETILPSSILSIKNTITVPSITTLRRRNTNSDPCNKENNEDLRFLEKVAKDIHCVPKYWKHLIKESNKLPFCETINQLEAAYQNITNLGEYLSDSIQPCLAMLLPVAVQKDEYHLDEKNIKIHILYTKTEYQEIINVKGFNFNSMFSGVGGFVGIFMGYSLLQATDLLETDNWKNLIRIVNLTFHSMFGLVALRIFKGNLLCSVLVIKIF